MFKILFLKIKIWPGKGTHCMVYFVKSCLHAAFNKAYPLYYKQYIGMRRKSSLAMYLSIATKKEEVSVFISNVIFIEELENSFPCAWG